MIERIRQPGELDVLEWYCENCDTKVHRREVEVTDIVKDLPPVFEEYYGDASLRVCPACGHETPANRVSNSVFLQAPSPLPTLRKGPSPLPV